MGYKVYKFKLDPHEDYVEVLIAELSERGFDSFWEEEGVLNAYLEEEMEPSVNLSNPPLMEGMPVEVSWETELLKDQNWNEEWERNYEPIEVDGALRIRATFHQPDASFPLEVVIEPKMSFGTGHHPTTWLMSKMLLEHPPKGMDVLDMGSGTGVLAILAKLLGSARTVGVDNNPWAFENAVENGPRNGVEVEWLLGDADTVPQLGVYHLILANINRNILLEDMKRYDQALQPGGQIWTSGYFEYDLHLIRAEAERIGWTYVGHIEKDRWCCAAFAKN